MERDEEFRAGYIDGRDLNDPEPGENRSHCYRHAWQVGRAEKLGTPIAAPVARVMADLAEKRDAQP